MGVYIAEFKGDVLITGGLFGLTSLYVPSSTILNSHISAAAGINASKLEHSYRYADMQAGEAADDTIFAFFVKGATLTFNHFTVSNIIACAGDSEVTVDVLKNGVSILDSAVTLTSSSSAYSENEGTITTTAAVDGDYITIAIDATASGTDALAQDVFWQLDYDEDYAD